MNSCNEHALRTILHEHSDVAVFICGEGSKTSSTQVHVFICGEGSKTSSTQVHKFSFKHRNTKVLLELVTHLIKIFPDVKRKDVTTKTHKRIQPIACEIH